MEGEKGGGSQAVCLKSPPAWVSWALGSEAAFEHQHSPWQFQESQCSTWPGPPTGKVI